MLARVPLGGVGPRELELEDPRFVDDRASLVERESRSAVGHGPLDPRAQIVRNAVPHDHAGNFALDVGE